jgi:HPt (histidine-containing phosphotransfer) domain-containing protein
MPGIQSLRDTMDKTSSNSPQSDPQRPVMDVERSLARMGGDRSLLQDLARFYLEDSGELLARLQGALESKDAKLAARSAHSLSGLSANFSADTCSAIAKSIEEASQKNDFETSASMLPGLQLEVSRLITALQREILIETP